MKKILSLVICLAVLLSAAATYVGAAYTPVELDDDNFDINQGLAKDRTFDIGDSNGDGTVNAIDSLYIKLCLAGASPDDLVDDAADFNGDGSISPIDSYNIKLCIAGVMSASDFEQDVQLYNLTIGGYDISEFSIVIEEKCQYSDNEYMAAELFLEYIKEATGKTLAIVRGEAAGRGIYIHDVDKDSELGAALGQEGYKYEVVDGDLHVYGTDRGNMYAAYEIIEDYLGFGFVDNHFTFVYKQRSVDIEEGTTRTFVPGFRFRQSKSTYNTDEAYRTRFALPRGINGSVGFNYDRANIPASYYGNYVGTIYIDIHSFNHYHQMATGTMPDESYGSLEMRYYAKYNSGEVVDETDWEPCASDEKEYNRLFTGLLEFIDYISVGRGYPFLYEDGTHCFSWSPCDNINWCSCRKCSKAARETSYVDVYLTLKNKGAVDIQDYYPGLKLYSLMYEKTAPVEVVPDKNLILVLGGNTCANHPLGTDEECLGNGFYKMSNKEFEQFVIRMGELCAQTGAELWMWYYPETNNWWLYDIPNIFAIYYDVTWCYQNGITGFYYEGHNLCPGYTFENLKAYMFSQISFDPEMSIETYESLIKEYLYMVYGHGWENMWQFLLMYEEAGTLVGHEHGRTEDYCYIGNYDRAFDLVSYEYIRDNYEEMRALIVATKEEYDVERVPGGEAGLDRLDRFLCVFDLLGLGASYVDSYLNGDEESRAIYEDRYEWVYNYYYDSGMRYIILKQWGTDRPATCNLDTNPLLQYTAISVRAEITKALSGK